MQLESSNILGDGYVIVATTTRYRRDGRRKRAGRFDKSSSSQRSDGSTIKVPTRDLAGVYIFRRQAVSCHVVAISRARPGHLERRTADCTRTLDVDRLRRWRRRCNIFLFSWFLVMSRHLFDFFQSIDILLLFFPTLKLDCSKSCSRHQMIQ